MTAVSKLTNGRWLRRRCGKVGLLIRFNVDSTPRSSCFDAGWLKRSFQSLPATYASPISRHLYMGCESDGVASKTRALWKHTRRRPAGGCGRIGVVCRERESVCEYNVSVVTCSYSLVFFLNDFFIARYTVVFENLVSQESRMIPSFLRWKMVIQGGQIFEIGNFRSSNGVLPFQMSEGRRTQVVLLDDRRLDIVVQPKLFVNELLNIVASHCHLKDTDKQYFGLVFYDERYWKIFSMA